MNGVHVETWEQLFHTKGGYMKAADGMWHCNAPCEQDAQGNLSAHEVVEHDDGTITVSPSILIRGGDGNGGFVERWHGYLEHGVWQSC